MPTDTDPDSAACAAAKAPDWHARALALPRDGRPFVHGQRVQAAATQTFDSLNPWDGSVVARLPACGEADVDRAVASARAAFAGGGWSGLAPAERADAVRRLADTVAAHGDELALLDALEMGMPIAQALGDIGLVTAMLRDLAALAERLADTMVPLQPGAMAFSLREPHGVVAVLSPWNFPAYVALTKLAPALLMGNTVVVKPSELASLSTLRIAELAAAAGLPPGVLNVSPGLGPEAGAALAGHADVDFVSFTGSSATARRVMAAAAASNLKRLALEGSGKSAQLVMPSVAGDLDAVADAVSQAIFWASGQVCVAGARLLVHRSLYEPLLQRLEARAAGWVCGDPLDERTTMGPLASPAQFQRVQRLVDGARSAGARVRAGGGPPPGLQGSLFYAPTILDQLDADAEIVQEEVFGPVLTAMPFDTAAQALALANRNRHGLYAYVHSRDLPETLALARGLRSGCVAVNAHALPPRAPPALLGCEPAGESGFGAEGGIAGLHTMTRLKAVFVSGA